MRNMARKPSIRVTSVRKQAYKMGNFFESVPLFKYTTRKGDKKETPMFQEWRWFVKRK